MGRSSSGCMYVRQTGWGLTMRWVACLVLVLVVHGADQEQLDGEPVELSRSSANALDYRATLLQTRAKTTFPSLAGDLSIGPKMGLQHHRLADENAEDAALAKASEVGQKLEKKASRWTSQANTHEKKA